MAARRGRAGWIGAAAAALVLLLAGALAHGALQRQYRAEIVEAGDAALGLYAEMTRGWLERYRTLAPIYARDPLVIATLLSPSTPERADALNRKLELWNAAAGTADTYVLTDSGRTLAASNWADEASFVGRNFAFRPYFQGAMEGRLGRFFGLGTTSGARGYYFAAPVRASDGVIGAVTVKISVEELEQELRLGPHQAFLTDESGVVILSGNPALRLTVLGEIDAAARDRIAGTRQFDLSALGPAPLETAGVWRESGLETVTGLSDRERGRPATFLHMSRPMNVEGWVLHVLVDTAPVRTRLLTTAVLALAALLAALAIAGLVWERRRRLVERLRDHERQQAQLERRVAERTADLSAANLRLTAEVGERRAAEASLRQTQNELVQAGKLAALGQMSAALSHEFNQPLTAIRTYSENAIAFVEAGAAARATENLSRVLRLTERMAQLSKHLTRFARRSQDTVDPVALDDALTETLALLAGRIERAEADVDLTGEEGLAVLGGQVRLQHVLMNLIGNALDAVPAGTLPRITVDRARSGPDVVVTVEDNGPGIAPDLLGRIFDPFFTTKEVGRGLGLGLSISYNIVKDFGGTMRAENIPGGGARFVVTLRAVAVQAGQAAE